VFDRVFGNDMDYFRAVSPWDLARQHADVLRQDLPIRVIIGARDEMLAINRRFHDHLDNLQIPHTFEILPEIEHDPTAFLNAFQDRHWAFYRKAIGTQIHVAPDAPENGNGSEERPLASLHEVRNAVRNALQSTAREQRITVFIHGDIYELPETLTFTTADSGTPENPVIYTAWPGDRPVISGGRRLHNWTRLNDNRWTTPIPAERENDWIPRQLFLDGERCPRARHPDAGFLRTDGPPRFSQSQRQEIDTRFGENIGFTNFGRLGKFGFRYREGDIRRWTNLEDATIHVMHAWTSAVHWIADLDETRRTVRFTGPSRFPASRFEQQMPYYVENIPEALDAPREWYFDRHTRLLTLVTQPDEDPRGKDAVASRLQTLIELAGDAHQDTFVEGLVFRGLTFEHTDWGPLDRGAENDGFGSVHFLDAAVKATGTRHCVFDGCRFAHCGGYALYLIDGSSHNRVERCEFADLGGGGILIGSRWSTYDTFKQELPPDDAPETWLSAYNMIDNNLIHHGGRIFRGVLGIFVAHAPYNRITHNEICAMPYSAICVGRRLDRKHSHAHHNEVAYNSIHHLGDGVMSDMAGVYTEGVSPGTRIHHNRVHHVQRYRYGGWGLYCDQSSAGIRLDHNIVTHCQDGGFMQNVGGPNTLENNILAFHEDRGMINSGRWRKGTPVDQLEVLRNIIWTNLGQVIGYHLEPEDRYRFNRNLYWHAPAPDLVFAGRSWQQWQESGRDTESIIADPRFTDPENGDFNLLPDSPAPALGFEPIDSTAIGLVRTPELEARAANLVFPPLTPLTPPPPSPIHEDFETLDPGETVPGATTFGETETAHIRVTEKTAAQGRRSLEFADAAKLPKSYWPWLAYRTAITTGRPALRFALCVGPGTDIRHEWRDNSRPYVVGPQLQITDSEVRAGNRLITRIPTDTWILFEIHCTLGSEAEGTYDITVHVPEHEPVTVNRLKCLGGNRFRTLNWLGFICAADADATAYLDDIHLENHEE
jgi:hypothetical protein